MNAPVTPVPPLLEVSDLRTHFTSFGGSRVIKAVDLEMLVDTGALCAERYTPELFKKVRRPIYPFDKIEA